ncbi:MAG TPA: SIR2 family protein [Chthoniobacterales bacterium]|nr:SIR2 family protein [Chthoniobacterales bacterium]
MKTTPAQAAPAVLLAKNLKERSDRFSDPLVAKESASWIDESLKRFRKDEVSWRDISTFWPPRCVQGFSTNNATAFFGAGVSLPAGFPSWQSLLVDYFQLDRNLVDDEDLKNDPLTLAELAAQVLGNETLQQRLRDVFGGDKLPTTSHRLLAELGCKIYVTTNYDALFEKAWSSLGRSELFIATNDTHLPTAREIIGGRRPGSVLFKIHGCVSRLDEHLILTRRDYRHHYRANAEFFNLLIELLRKRHTLFVGFSHRDPEVSRLVDDAIHQFENNPHHRTTEWPQFYSLQFDMRSHTPEIFAARGIVALTPPSVLPADPATIRSHALAAALSDLILSKTLALHTDTEARLDVDLSSVISQIEDPLNEGLDALARENGNALKLIHESGPADWLDRLQTSLGPLAAQGLYVANEAGQILACSLPKGLSVARKADITSRGVSERPYFQIANSFRKAFVSDQVASLYNKHGTFFLCQPLLNPNGTFAGLMFAAAQIGQWRVPIELAEAAWQSKRGFILTDSNGVCLLPAFGEFGVSSVAWDGDSHEPPECNAGYPYQKLLGLSRRDQLVRHITKSVVPVQQDDDVLVLSSDSTYYTVVSEVANTRWKLGLSMSMTK